MLFIKGTRENTARGIWKSREGKENSKLNMASSLDWAMMGMEKQEWKRDGKEEDKREDRKRGRQKGKRAKKAQSLNGRVIGKREAR